MIHTSVTYIDTAIVYFNGEVTVVPTVVVRRDFLLTVS